MWNCKNCGKLNEDRANYCDKCGASKKYVPEKKPRNKQEKKPRNKQVDKQRNKRWLLESPTLLYFLVALIIYIVLVTVFFFQEEGFLSESPIKDYFVLLSYGWDYCFPMFILLLIVFSGAEQWKMWPAYVIMSACNFSYLKLDYNLDFFDFETVIAWTLYVLLLIGIALLIYRRKYIE